MRNSIRLRKRTQVSSFKRGNWREFCAWKLKIMHVWEIDNASPIDTEGSTMPGLKISGCQDSLYRPPRVVQSLIDGGACDNTKSILCFSPISIASNTFYSEAKKKNARQEAKLYDCLLWYFPRFFTSSRYWISVVIILLTLLRRLYVAIISPQFQVTLSIARDVVISYLEIKTIDYSLPL